MPFMEGINELLIKTGRILNKARLDWASFYENISQHEAAMTGFKSFHS